VRVEQAAVGARVVDSYPFSEGGDLPLAEALAADGVQCLVGYLGHMNAFRLSAVLAAGLAFMPVTTAGEYEDGAADEITQLKALGIPSGCTVWLDLEGQKAFHSDPSTLLAKLRAWAQAIAAAGYMPGLYVGVPQPLTSEELYQLPFVRYWRGQGSIRDRNNALAEPSCGWCMTQMFPQHMRAGVLVDDDIVGQDYRGRVPAWLRA
jgi:hypothetical protein